MNHRMTVIPAILMSACAVFAFERTDSTSDIRIYEALDSNSPLEFQFAKRPVISITDRNRNFALEAGGFVKLTACYDFGSPVDNPNEFATSAIPFNTPAGNNSAIQFSAMQSSLYVNFVAMPASRNAIGAFVGVNFLSDYCPVIQFAYLRYRGIKAGYDYTLFSDPAADAPTIDYEGPSACTSIPVAQIGYTLSFGKEHRWSAGAGIEMPQASFSTGARLQQVSQRIPDIPAFVRYEWNGGHIKLSAMLRNLLYRNTTAGKNIDKVGWGLQIAGTSEIAGGLSCFWQCVAGQGISSYIQDLSGQNMDMCPDITESSMNLIKTWGITAGLVYSISERMTASAGYSQVRPYTAKTGGNDPYTYPDRIRFTQYVYGNVMYDINRWFQTGIEYIYGRRMNNSGKQAHNSRLQISGQITF